MHIDCDTCAIRGASCRGCVVTLLLGAPPEGVEFDETEQAALEVLAQSGLIRPLLISGPEIVSRSVRAG